MLQLLVSGLAIGAIYSLASLGFVIIFNASGAVNFAHGDFIMVGGFTAVMAASIVGGALGIPLMFLITALVMFALGAAFYYLAYRPLRGKPFLAVFVSTLAVGMALRYGMQLVRGAQPATMDPLISGSWTIFGVQIRAQAILILIIAAVLVIIQRAAFKYTRIGREMRATAQDYQTAQLLGIRVGRIQMLSFGSAAILAGFAGILVAPLFFLTIDMGLRLILVIYIAVVLGGFGNLTGAVIGSLLLGLIEVFAGAFIGPEFQTITIFVLLIVLLLVRPQGLFGETPEGRA